MDHKRLLMQQNQLEIHRSDKGTCGKIRSQAWKRERLPSTTSIEFE